MDLKEFVKAEFGEQQKCYGHCDQPATLRFLDEDGMLVVGVVCHAGYASKIIAYGDSLDPGRFKSFISSALRGGSTVADEDIRTATRFSWDVAGGTGRKVMKAAHWTQNYRRTKSDDPERTGLFACQNCSSLYLQPVNERNVLCDGCHSDE